MKKTTKQKLDELLGIQDNLSIDDFLGDLDINELTTPMLSAAYDQLKTNVHEDIAKIDGLLGEISNTSMNGLEILKDLDSTLKEVEEMFKLSKKMAIHVYESICSSDLIDPELVSSVSKLLETIHINQSEFIQLYTERRRFVDKVRLMIFNQQQRIELMELRHKHELEKIKCKAKNAPRDVNEGMVVYSQDDIIKALDDSNSEFYTGPQNRFVPTTRI